MKSRWTDILSTAFLCAVLLLGSKVSSRAQEKNTPGEGLWGGVHVSMQTAAQGAALEFDCAHGAILEAIKPDAAGKFAVRGTFTPERGGPVRKDNPPRDLPAVYTGTIDGEVMHLEITLAGQQEALGTFTLTRGDAGRIVKCR